MDEEFQFKELDTRPLYLQAVDIIKRYLKQSGLKPQDLLPPEAELAPKLGISRSTLREAMGYLEREGWVLRRQGIGTFVMEGGGIIPPVGLETLTLLGEMLTAHGQAVETAFHECSRALATPEQATLLHVQPGSELMRVQHVLATQGERLAFFDAIMPSALVDAEDLERSGLSIFEYLLRVADLVTPYAVAVMNAFSANDLLASRLSVPNGTAIMRLQETYYQAPDRPIMFSDSYYVTDRFSFTIVRRVDPTLVQARQRRLQRVKRVG